MRWTPGGQSPNLEDRRGQSSGGRLGGGFGGGYGRGGVRIGLVGFLILGIGSLVLKTNLFDLVAGNGSTYTEAGGPVASTPEEDREVQFVSFVLDDVQSTWAAELPHQARSPYRDAHLVLFRDGTDTGCGYADAGVGPFYCGADERVYLDLSFFDELHERFGAAGDFAQAYVIGHEFGHHVQHILGTDARAHGDSASSVALELQADCYAGVWGYTAQQRGILETGDVQEALGAAAAIGDDRLQRQAGRAVSPETFTHGSSVQRVEWFQRGFSTGRMDQCDTFATPVGRR
jgi:predicted metalloprotease